MTDTAAETAEPLQRIIFPGEHDPDVVPLYVDADYWTSFPVYESESERKAQRGFIYEDTERATVRLSDKSVLSNFVGRRGMRVPHRRQVSFGTYFNAFPASYWKKWTILEAVVLRLKTRGEGQVLVSRSNARGVIQRVDSAVVTGDATSEFLLDFTFFGDGGWFWFDLIAEDADFELVEGGWFAPAGVEPTRGAGKASIAITTFNRAEYCTKLLSDIGANTEVAALLDRVYVIDQGTQKIVDAEGYPAAREALGDKLDVIVQANLGGSGGFSRGMLETLRAKTSDYVLLLDDDIQIEPESIHRAIRFADYAIKPTIVGGHMFDMYDKSVLHAYAETIEMNNFMWGPSTPQRHNFSRSNLRQTKWMHRRIDTLYNGWWMCLIPMSIVEEIGLALPVFIKWDDAEYALRAAEHGYSTVSLPGAAVWHVSWVDKDDSQDWQAFFHARNRLIAALLHSPKPRGGRLSRANFATDLRQLFSMQYYAVTARQAAYENILRGPGQLHDDIKVRQRQVRELAKQFGDAQVIRDKHDLPPVTTNTSSNDEIRRVRRHPPQGLALYALLARFGLRSAFKKPPADAATRAQAQLAFSDARWWIVPSYDSLLISNAEGSGAIWHKRDPKLFRSLFWKNARLRRKIINNWPTLSAQYRDALPEYVSPEVWAKTFRDAE